MNSQSIGASASVFPMNIQGWFPLALMGLISLLSKRLSRVFSSITVWKHQFCIRVTCNLLWPLTRILWKWILRVVMKCKLIYFIDIWLEFSVYLFIYFGSKITADGDCSHEIKRRLLLGRKVMSNLDSTFKSRDIALPAKVRLVKAMVFPVVMYGCESWTVKKAEHQRIDAFGLWFWRRLLRVSWTARRSNPSIIKEINHECSSIPWPCLLCSVSCLFCPQFFLGIW